jgi:phosphate-selective porin OprO and OprP
MKYLFIFLLVISIPAISQSPDNPVNFYSENTTITWLDSELVRMDSTIKQQESEISKKLFPANAARQLMMTGFGQIRYQNLDERGKMDGFDFHRARLDIKGSINSRWSYRFMTDLAGSPKLMDVYAEYKLAEYLNLTLGQTKIPFSLESTFSDAKLEFIDRSLVVEALVARGKDIIGNQSGRDLGLQAGGSLIKLYNRFLFDYMVGILNGSGINTGDNNENKDLSGRFIFHLVKGLDFGGSLYKGTGFYGKTVAENHTRNRAGAELSYENSRINLKSEFIQGIDGGTLRNGWYVQTGYYIIPQKMQFLAKYDTYDPDTSAPDDISTIYMFCLNYNFNSFTRIQAAYGFRLEQGTAVNNNLGSIQLQIGF